MNKKGALAGLLALGLMLPAAAYGAEEDRFNPGPVLDQIQIGSEVAAPGGRLSIAADAWDDDGIRSIWVRFIHDETGTVLSVPMKRRFGDPRLEGYWSAELEIPKDAPLGGYALRSVVLLDDKDGRSRYFREADMKWDSPTADLLEEEFSFTLVADTAGPVLQGCQVLADTVQAGEDENGDLHTVQVTLAAEDQAAGFQKAALVFQSEKGKKIYAALDRNDWQHDNVYQKDIPVREHLPEGNYRLVKATLEDRAGNKTVLGYGKDALPLDDAFGCGFRVLSQEDSRGLAPVLRSVSLGARREIIGGGMEQEVIVKATDRGSQLHHVTVRFKNDQTGRAVSRVIRAEDQEHALGEGVYTGWLEIGDWEPEGRFTLDGVVVTDQAGNAQTYRRPGDTAGSQLALPNTLSFTAATGVTREDTQAPVVTALEMEGETEVGFAITLRAKAADDLSGVDTIRARFENDEKRVITVTLREKEDGWFSGDIPGGKLTRWDQFHLVRLVVTDRAGNQRAYQQQAGLRGEALPQQVSFTVREGKD